MLYFAMRATHTHTHERYCRASTEKEEKGEKQAKIAAHRVPKHTKIAFLSPTSETGHKGSGRARTFLYISPATIPNDEILIIHTTVPAKTQSIERRRLCGVGGGGGNSTGGCHCGNSPTTRPRATSD